MKKIESGMAPSDNGATLAGAQNPQACAKCLERVYGNAAPATAGMDPCSQCVSRDETGRCCGWPQFTAVAPIVPGRPKRWHHHGVPVGEPKQLILGTALTGAKFTPGNHRAQGDAVLDAILQGKLMPIQMEEIEREVDALVRDSVRYVHWHARHPATREQSADPKLYRAFGLATRERHPGLALSCGASRNGRRFATPSPPGENGAGSATPRCRCPRAGLIL